MSHVTLDKTGTLTHGQFQVAAVHACPGWTSQQLLRLLGSAERGSTHPLAAAVLGYAAAQSVPCDAPVEGLTAVHGAGVTALVDGRRLVAGTPGLLASAAGVQGLQAQADQADAAAEGTTTCFVAVDGQLAGWVRWAGLGQQESLHLHGCRPLQWGLLLALPAFRHSHPLPSGHTLPACSARDTLRLEAGEAVAMLRRLGCGVAMLTGDAAPAARSVGAAAGIPPDCIHARLLPEQKLQQARGGAAGARVCCPALPCPALPGCWAALRS